MDEETRNVLAALQQNAKGNIATIAKECHMSKAKCSRTIRHLEKTQKIWGYTAIVDERDLLYNKFILLLKRSRDKLVEINLDDVVAKEFKQLYEPLGVRIESTYYLQGDYDWVVVITAPDLWRAKKFSHILFDHFPMFDKNVNIMEVLFTRRAHYIVNPDQSKLRELLSLV